MIQIESKLNDKIIVVTGGYGFIGSFLVKRLLICNVRRIIIIDNQKYSKDYSRFKKNDKISFHKISLNEVNTDQLVEIFRGSDFLFHLAAEKYNQSRDNPLDILRANVIGTTTLMEAALKVGIKKVVFSSSLYSYGRRNLPAMLETEKSNPSTIYGISKLAGEHILSYYDKLGVEYNVLRYFFVYGPRQYSGFGYKSVIIKNFQRMLSGKSPIINGDGHQALDYSFVSDIIEGTLSAMLLNVKSEVINLGSGKAITINELTNKMKMIARYSGKNIYADPDETDGTIRICDNNKAIKLLSFNPKIDIDEGLRITYEWMKNG